MKRRPRWMQLIALTLAAVVLAILAAMTVSNRDLDVAVDAKVRNQLRELARLDAQLNAEMLEARDGIEPNYDRLVDVENELESAFADLNAGRLGHITDEPSITKTLADFQTLLARKSDILDDIKFERAAAVNSSRYFPHAFAEVTSTEPQVVSDTHRLESLVLTYTLAPGEIDPELKTLLARLLAAGDGPLRRAAIHADRIVKHLPLLDAYAGDLLRLPTSKTIDALSVGYGEWRRAREERAGHLRAALEVTSIALLLSMAWVLRQIARTNATARRFVPYEFLDALGKGSLADVKRGDAVRKEMSVLFSDIRGFTSTAEKHSPEDNFKFINEYLGAMESPIRSRRGFVNQYLGDGIVALFPHGADDAVQAGIEMFRALDAWNATRNGKAVRIGVGVNSGSLMLGTLGGNTGMQAGVISHAVNLGARIEGLTKHYGVNLLISGHTRDRLLDPTKYLLRTVDRVLVKGAERPVTVYELLDVDDADVRARKRELLARHEDAMQHYFARRFREALRIFATHADAMPEDRVSAIFAARCVGFLKAPPPPTWDGLERVEAK